MTKEGLVLNVVCLTISAIASFRILNLCTSSLCPTLSCYELASTILFCLRFESVFCSRHIDGISGVFHVGFGLILCLI